MAMNFQVSAWTAQPVVVGDLPVVSPEELRVEVTHSDRITVAVIAPGKGGGGCGCGLLMRYLASLDDNGRGGCIIHLDYVILITDTYHQL